jgi:hypothetical protein
MNKKTLFSLILSAFLLVSCSSNTEVKDNNLTLNMIESGIDLKVYLENGDSLEASSPEIIRAAFEDYPNLHSEQITAYFTIGDLSFAFVSQPNSWTPLLEVRDWEKEGNTAWSGLLVKHIKGPWEILFEIPEEDFNPLALRVEDEALVLDIVDDSGAGSGEGTLLRYAYPFDGFTEENLYKWMKQKCDGYYVPETYTEKSCS